MIFGFQKLMCSICNKPRLHETLFGFAKCVICKTNVPIEEQHEVEEFIG